MEAIVLAGGLGTRLQSSVPDLPKCLAPINRKPFLHYLLTSMIQSGISRFVFSLGYRSASIIDYLNDHYCHIDWDYAIEDQPLGTGGGIRLAMDQVQSPQCLILNGDTLFKADVQALYQYHLDHNAVVTLALKPMSNFDRYGTVGIQNDGKVFQFTEKQYCKSGYINGGVYAIDTAWYLSLPEGPKYSFETEVLQRYVTQFPMYGKIDDGYFIDIGIPDDYEKAKSDFSTMF